MPDETDINNAIAQAATDGIKRVRGDQGEVEALSIQDQIAAAKHTAAQAANSGPKFGVRYGQLVPAGGGA